MTEVEARKAAEAEAEAAAAVASEVRRESAPPDYEEATCRSHP